MKTEDLIKLEFGRLQAYIARHDFSRLARNICLYNPLVEQDLYTSLHDKALQADYNIAAYLNQMRLSGTDVSALEQKFNQLRDECSIRFPRTLTASAISLPALRDAPLGGYE